jgi:hypothetical protein
MLELAHAGGAIGRDRYRLWRDDGSAFPASSFDLVMTTMVTLTTTLLEAVARAADHLIGSGVLVMVEQVDTSRSLRVADYARELQAVGFTIRTVRVARRGSRSPSQSILRRVPGSGHALGLLARIEWTTGPWLGVPQGGYADCVIIAVRDRASASLAPLAAP